MKKMIQNLSGKYITQANSKDTPVTMDLTFDDLMTAGFAEIDSKGLVNHHIESANDLITRGLPQIITEVFQINVVFHELYADVKPIKNVTFHVKFTNFRMDHPVTIDSETGKEVPAFPNMMLMYRRTYKSPAFISAIVEATALYENGEKKTRTAVVEDVRLTNIPIVVKSKLCNTVGRTPDALRRLNEDPNDPGGYFICKGIERSGESVENILFNDERIFIQSNYKNEEVRLEYLSKPGDHYLNSGRFVMVLTRDGEIVINMDRSDFRAFPLPFFLVFRLFGWSRDKTIIDHVMVNVPEAIKEDVKNILIRAFNAPYPDMYRPLRHTHTSGEVLKHLSKIMGAQFKDKFKLADAEEHYQKVGETIMSQLDMFFLVHMGDTPASRDNKLKVLCYQINKMLMTYFEILPPTDRDSYVCKRIHPVGTNFAKIFKSLFHTVVVRGIVSKFSNEFEKISFDKIKLDEIFRSSIASSKLEADLISVISRGVQDEIEIGGQVRKQHFHSQQLGPRNLLNILSLLRNIIIVGEAGKATNRAMRMRQVHPTASGFIDCVHSPESIKGGLTKNMTLLANITKSRDETIVDEILQDPDIKPFEEVTLEERQRTKLCNVFFNGKWIGFCKNSFEFAEKYRNKRRQGKFLADASIIWNMILDEIHFRVDSCRLIRPVFIVYNTFKNPERFTAEERRKGFMQKIAFTKKHAELLRQRKITIENDLIPQGILEYISIDEMPNCLIAADMKILEEHIFDECLEFTHLDIPASQLGLTALTCPFAGHNQTTRIIYQTNQAKQTCGMVAQNWPFRPYKDTCLAYISETPVVRTVYNNFVNPNGLNTIVAIMTYCGENQEDSIIMNQGAVDRGEFNCCKITYVDSILEKSEVFRAPDLTNTKNIRQGANYSKLVSMTISQKKTISVVPRGTLLQHNDVVIGKSVKISKVTDAKQEEFPYSDISVIYKDTEEVAIVHDVIAGINEDDKDFIKIVLRKFRPVAIGDKFSSRAGQKGIVSITLPEEDMPASASGIIPSAIINPHAIPSRMTIGQLFESVTGTWCAQKGIETDATIFRTDNRVDDICEELKKMGFDEHGEERLFSGITGTWIGVRIFMGVTYLQRLQKYGIETVYSVARGPTDKITRQPVDGGKPHSGGLRLGDMEKYCLIAHGSLKTLLEKFTDHSDGIKEYMCVTCGKAATVNTHLNYFSCPRCGDGAEFGYVKTTWCAKLLTHTLESIGMGITKIPAPREYFASA